MARVLYAEAPESDKRVLDIALSERNLLVLLTKLYTPGSACTLTSGDVPDDVGYARIRVEPDEYHYEVPTRNGAPPGAMHPLSEAIATAVKAILEEDTGLLTRNQ